MRLPLAKWLQQFTKERDLQKSSLILCCRQELKWTKTQSQWTWRCICERDDQTIAFEENQHSTLSRGVFRNRSWARWKPNSWKTEIGVLEETMCGAKEGNPQAGDADMLIKICDKMHFLMSKKDWCKWIERKKKRKRSSTLWKNLSPMVDGLAKATAICTKRKVDFCGRKKK